MELSYYLKDTVMFLSIQLLPSLLYCAPVECYGFDCLDQVSPYI